MICRLTVFIFLIFTGILNAQTKYFTKTGEIDFEASVPSFEEVKAKNNTISAILNVSTGEIAALALVKGFRFKVALMEEHFNENYAETEKFPKASFSGKIGNFSMDDLNNKAQYFELKGSIKFHGKTSEIIETVSIHKENDTVFLSTNFQLIPEEFDIKFPKIIRKKIAENVEVAVNLELLPKS
jgi:hypothetical protein